MGYANPDAMLAEMPATVLDEWVAFFHWREKQRAQAEQRSKDEARTQQAARRNARSRWA